MAAVASLYALWTYRSWRALRGRDRVDAARDAHRAVRASRSSRCCGRCCCSRSRCRSRTSSASSSTTRAACRSRDQDGKPRATSSRTSSAGTDGAAAHRARQAVQRRGLPVLVVGRAAAVHRRPDVRGHGHAARRRARSRARRAERPAGRRPRPGHRRRGQRATTTLDESIAGLKAQAMPVFSVGVGRERLTRDVQVTRAETPRRVLKGAVARRRRRRHADRLRRRRRCRSSSRTAAASSARRTSRCRPTAKPRRSRSGSRRPTSGRACSGSGFPCRANEEVAQNNQRDALIEVYNRREKILYLEGEPRPEPKFIRQATDEDDNLQVVLLQRTAEADGQRRRTSTCGSASTAPRSCRTASRRRARSCSRTAAIILGSVEATAFTPEQQRMLEDFVDVRGGGLLALGGDAVVRRRRLGRHAARRRAAGRARAAGARQPTYAAVDGARRPADARRADPSRRRRSPTRKRTPRRSGATCRR